MTVRPTWPFVAEIDQGPFDAMNALAHGRLGQPDQDGLGQPRRDIDLHLDRHGVDSDQGKGSQLGEHERLRKSGW